MAKTKHRVLEFPTEPVEIGDSTSELRTTIEYIGSSALVRAQKKDAPDCSGASPAFAACVAAYRPHAVGVISTNYLESASSKAFFTFSRTFSSPSSE